MIEIIFYFIIAVVIFIKLYDSFGRGPDVVHKIVESTAHDIDSLNRNLHLYTESHLIASAEKTIKDIQKYEKDFSLDKFIEGSKKAFEIVINSANKWDTKDLETFVKKDVVENMNTKFEDVKKLKHKNMSTLISIQSAKILEFYFKNSSEVFSKVQFSSEQIYCIKDENDNIIKGHPSEVVLLKDTWVFSRNVKDLYPKWQLISIQ